MILFVPAYDEATHSNLAIANLICSPNMMKLLAQEATPEKFVSALQEQPDWPVFAMSHGTPDSLKAQNGQPALSTKQVELLGQRACYVFACHTATELGQRAATIGSSWWGYVGKVSCAIDSPLLLSRFVEIFRFLQDQFHLETTVLERQLVLEELKKKCEQVANILDRVDPPQSFMEEYVTLAHLWERLRIWVPGSKLAEKHPSASEPVPHWF